MNPSKKIVLDANILVRGVLGMRVPELLERYHENVWFYTPSSCLAEARKHLPAIVNRRSHIDAGVVLHALDALSAVVQPVKEVFPSGIRTNPRRRLDKTRIEEIVLEFGSEMVPDFLDALTKNEGKVGAADLPDSSMLAKAIKLQNRGEDISKDIRQILSQFLPYVINSLNGEAYETDHFNFQFQKTEDGLEIIEGVSGLSFRATEKELIDFFNTTKYALLYNLDDKTSPDLS